MSRGTLAIGISTALQMAEAALAVYPQMHDAAEILYGSHVQIDAAGLVSSTATDRYTVTRVRGPRAQRGDLGAEPVTKAPTAKEAEVSMLVPHAMWRWLKAASRMRERRFEGLVSLQSFEVGRDAWVTATLTLDASGAAVTYSTPTPRGTYPSVWRLLDEARGAKPSKDDEHRVAGTSLTAIRAIVGTKESVLFRPGPEGRPTYWRPLNDEGGPDGLPLVEGAFQPPKSIVEMNAARDQRRA